MSSSISPYHLAMEAAGSLPEHPAIYKCKVNGKKYEIMVYGPDRKTRLIMLQESGRIGLIRRVTDVIENRISNNQLVHLGFINSGDKVIKVRQIKTVILRTGANQVVIGEIERLINSYLDLNDRASHPLFSLEELAKLPFEHLFHAVVSHPHTQRILQEEILNDLNRRKTLREVLARGDADTKIALLLYYLKNHYSTGDQTQGYVSEPLAWLILKGLPYAFNQEMIELLYQEDKYTKFTPLTDIDKFISRIPSFFFIMK